MLLAACLLSAEATSLTQHGQAHAHGPAESDEDWQDSEDPAGALLGAQLRPIPMSDELEVRSHLFLVIPWWTLLAQLACTELKRRRCDTKILESTRRVRPAAGRVPVDGCAARRVRVAGAARRPAAARGAPAARGGRHRPGASMELGMHVSCTELCRACDVLRCLEAGWPSLPL